MEMHGVAGWADAVSAAWSSRYGVSPTEARFAEGPGVERGSTRSRILEWCNNDKQYTVTEIMALAGTGRDCVRKELTKMEREGLAKHIGGRGSGRRSIRLWEVTSTMGSKVRMCAGELSKCFGGYAYSTC